MNVPALFNRWRNALAERTAARHQFEAIIYFVGPLTKWERSGVQRYYEEHKGGLRIPIADAVGHMMAAPNAKEVLQRQSFRFEFIARGWVVARLRGFDHTKIVGEVRPL